MIAVVTGMVGLDKKSYLQQVCGLAAARGHEVVLCNVGEMMYAEAPDVRNGKILDLPLRRLESLRRSVFKDIISQARKVPNMIVNTHATFRWQHGLFPAIDFDQMRMLGADSYVNLIDGVIALHHRLTGQHSIEHTLKDLIVWREEEMIATEMLVKGIDGSVPFYCVARGVEEETVETFYRLLFEKNRRAYLSFPMSHVWDMENIRRELEKFRATMKGLFTCFDPADLEEAFLPLYADHAQRDGRDYIETEYSGRKVRLKLDEVKQIVRDVNSQIYARDFLLIDQSDMIISYIPAAPDGHAILASGVERELQHAHEAAKEVYVIWTAKVHPSVFVTQTATKVFNNIEEATSYFTQKGYTRSDTSRSK